MPRLPFGPDEIRMLSSMLHETGLSEIELADGEVRIRLVRAGPQPASGESAQSNAVTNQPVAPMAPFSQQAASAAPAPDANAVRSTMTGIAYLAPGPGQPPFVRIGDQVEAGQTLLTIEAMKTFHSVAAHRAGTVKSVLVQSGDFVEFDQPLMILD